MHGKLLFPCLAALAFPLAAPAQAQVIDASGQALRLQASAAMACVLGQASAVAANNASFNSGGSANGQISITALVNPQDATSLASSLDLAVPVRCNASHRLVVRSANGGLQRRSAGDGGQRGAEPFSEFLAYSYTLGWAGHDIGRSSDMGELSLDVATPAQGELQLRVSTQAGGGPLVAGQYGDTLVIEFQPAG